ncbi:hypothetical protein GWK47_024401 [Chionoecetes opilio]|uniref:Uncharacterized protein n=1 Tax=Chionoecetes opilio TaxID=41210 RepID=A0A8J4XL20_CHIOP|nr:hypothetical protein GWK47_024401 [Chionoecetes opilio]
MLEPDDGPCKPETPFKTIPGCGGGSQPPRGLLQCTFNPDTRPKPPPVLATSCQIHSNVSLKAVFPAPASRGFRKACPSRCQTRETPRNFSVSPPAPKTAPPPPKTFHPQTGFKNLRPQSRTKKTGGALRRRLAIFSRFLILAPGDDERDTGYVRWWPKPLQHG